MVLPIENEQDRLFRLYVRDGFELGLLRTLSGD